MAKIVISAADVERAASSGVLSVPADAIVTPLAKDVAAEMHVVIERGEPAPDTVANSRTQDIGSDELAGRIRAVVASLLGSRGDGESAAPTAAKPVKHATMRDAVSKRFAYPGPPEGMDVRTAEVVDASDGAPVAVGYMSITKGSFPWTLTYDEVQVILEGELHLGTPTGVKVGRPGDILFIPNGTPVTFSTPSWAKFAYMTFPAEWEDQI